MVSTKEQATYHAFKYLPGLILPILCRWIPSLTLRFLFGWSAPRDLDVGEFEVWMEDYGG